MTLDSSKEKKQGLIVRKLSVQQEGGNNEATRQITLIQETQWADNTGLEENMFERIQYLLQKIEKNRSLKAPIVVHCS